MSLPDDLIADILLRLALEDPAGIVWASAVCKTWRSIIGNPAFARRYRALHPTAPVLGFLHNQSEIHVSRFVPTTSFRPSAAEHRRRHAHDCRHGRAVFLDYGSLQSFVVWDLITGDLHKSPDGSFGVLTQPAVVCAAGDGCDHRGCSGGPFIVAFAGLENVQDLYMDAHAAFYSSDTGRWSLHINIHLDRGRYYLLDRPPALVGDALYFVGGSGFLLRYCYGLLRRVGGNIISEGYSEADVLSVIKPPPGMGKHHGNFLAMTAQDGGLGLASLYPNSNRLSLWAREETAGSVGDNDRWVQRRVIDLESLLPISNPERRPYLSGVVAEGANAIFVSTEDGVFTIELKSSQVKKVCDMGELERILPFVSFYIDSWLLKLVSRKLPAAPAPVENQ